MLYVEKNKSQKYIKYYINCILFFLERIKSKKIVYRF